MLGHRGARGRMVAEEIEAAAGVLRSDDDAGADAACRCDAGGGVSGAVRAMGRVVAGMP